MITALVEARLNDGLQSSTANLLPTMVDSTESDASLFMNVWTPPITDPMSYTPSTTIPEFSVPLDLSPYPIEGMVWPDLSNQMAKVPPVDDELQTMLPNVMDSFPSLQEIQDLCVLLRTHTIYR